MDNDQGDYRPREFGRITWLVKLAEREVGRELDRELRHTGLTKSQFGVLQALMHLEQASSAALARTVFVTPQAMVGIVAGLERKGFIRRKSSKVSARAIDATVTAAGKSVYAEARAHDPATSTTSSPRSSRRRARPVRRVPGAHDRRHAARRPAGRLIGRAPAQRNTAKHLFELNTCVST